LFSVVFLVALAGPPAWGQAGDPVPEPNDPEEAVPDSVVGTWIYNADARLNVSQAAYSNWEEGAGNNSLALATGLRGEAMKRGEHWIQAHELRLAFGLINQEGQELRKAEDQILLNTSLRYEGDDFFRLFNPTMAADLRTQFAKGFDFSSNPFEGDVPEEDPRLDREPPVETSRFFAPAFITESIGLTYEPVPNFTLRFGAASKQTIVTERDFRVLYGVSEGTVARVEAGAEFASAFDRQLTENIRYRSQLNIFFSFNQVEQPPDARWDNTLSLAVNDWLSTDLQFVALFDEDITDAIQLKETISVGLSFTLI
jgi:transcriptional regulator with XRE-family HTH domain